MISSNSNQENALISLVFLCYTFFHLHHAFHCDLAAVICDVIKWLQKVEKQLGKI